MKSIILLTVGVVSGVILVQLFQGGDFSESDERFGSGIKNMLEFGLDTSKSATSELINESMQKVRVTSDKEFTFWETLPKLEQILPDNISESDAINVPDDKYVYFLQIASFTTEQDADGLRARLALAGFETFSQRVELEGAGTRYRVRTSTYDSQRVTKNLKQALQDEGVNPITIRLDAS
ncbi:MAG: SPOR domain-containing protein [Proteobacteria bacterium]|nr:SPOR domain-containing protein [Pseudomonadota bacterium]